MVHLQLEVKSPTSRLRMDNLSPTPEEQASVLLSDISKLGDATASPSLPPSLEPLERQGKVMLQTNLPCSNLSPFLLGG